MLGIYYSPRDALYPKQGALIPFCLINSVPFLVQLNSGVWLAEAVHKASLQISNAQYLRQLREVGVRKLLYLLRRCPMDMNFKVHTQQLARRIAPTVGTRLTVACLPNQDTQIPNLSSTSGPTSVSTSLLHSSISSTTSFNATTHWLTTMPRALVIVPFLYSWSGRMKKRRIEA